MCPDWWVLVFIGTLVTTTILVSPEIRPSPSFGCGLTILFFLGLKDDSSGTPLEVGHPDHRGRHSDSRRRLHDGDFSGLFGVGSSVSGRPCPSRLRFIVVVNSVNLIGGIDTLAGGYGFLVAISCALWFQLTGQSDFAILCLSLAGALAGFILFNISPARIFLGDSGSLILGMFIYVMASSIMATPTEQVPAMWPTDPCRSWR